MNRRITKGLRSIRIWLSELPPVGHNADGWQEASLPLKSSSLAVLSKAGIEIFIPTGGRPRNGLLGSEFHRDTLQSTLKLRVGYSLTQGEILPWAMASSVDEVRQGLPKCWADAVMTGALAEPAIANLGPGLLSFNCAAAGHVGGDEALFRQMSAALIRLMITAEEALSDECLLKLVNL